jgi:hypothetical protein
MSKYAAKWVYTLTQGYSWHSGLSFEHDQEFRDVDGKVRLILWKSGLITVSSGYSWDGCSPTFQIFDLLIGVPDGATDIRTGMPKTYYASLIHDALCQFYDQGLGMTWLQVNQCFLRLLEEADFAPRRIYYWMVKIYSGRLRNAVRRLRRYNSPRGTS